MTSSLTPTATDALICPLLKTGRADCLAHFDRALYQLTLKHEQQEELLELGFSGSRVLERLLQAPGEVVSREELMAYAWEGRVVGQGSLNQQIYTLRQALSDSRSQIIQTLPRRGYLFNPHYLIAEPSTTSEPQASAVEIQAPEQPVPAPSPLPIPDAAALAAATGLASRARSWQIAALAGTGMMLLLGLATLGFRWASAVTPSFTQKLTVGGLEVLYVERSQRLLDSLVKETRQLVDTMSGMSAGTGRLIVNMSPGFYEVRCLQHDGRVNWLKIHKSQIQTTPSGPLEGCLR